MRLSNEKLCTQRSSLCRRTLCSWSLTVNILALRQQQQSCNSTNSTRRSSCRNSSNSTSFSSCSSTAKPSLVRKLLSDAATCGAYRSNQARNAVTNVLRRYILPIRNATQSEVHPSNQERDAMTKLGSDWNTPQKKAGRREPLQT